MFPVFWQVGISNAKRKNSMPNRILREGILTSERVASLNWAEEVFFRRLMSVVDDYGRYTANPKLIRAACYPLVVDKVSDADINKWMAKCVEAGLVSVYSVSADADDQKGSPRCGKPAGVSQSLQKQYVQLHNFRQQTRTTASKYPPMTGDCTESPDKRLADDSQVTSTRLADDSHTSTVFGDGDGDVYEDVKKSKPKKEAGEFVLPDWIDQGHWDAWRSHPKLKNASDKQKSVAVEKLRKWKDAGEDYAGALENAAASGYQGLFLPDKQQKTARKPSQNSETFRERDARLAAERMYEFAPGIARKTAQSQRTITVEDEANVIAITGY